VTFVGRRTAVTGHAVDRSDQMTGGLDSGMWTWSPMMDGCAGGGMMPGGGM